MALRIHVPIIATRKNEETVYGSNTARLLQSLEVCHEHEEDYEDEATAQEEFQPSRFSIKLGYVVHLAHYWFIKYSHPYFVCLDLGYILGIIIALLYIERNELKVNPVYYTAIFLLVNYFGMELFQLLKRKLLKMTSRSFLQDTALFLVPSMYGLFKFTHMEEAWDACGVNFAVSLAFIRIGCFFGGCCYGKRSRWGVYYPKYIFQVYSGKWRKFASGKKPHGSVLPVQLFEALYCSLTAYVLFFFNFSYNKFVLFAIFYTAWRFLSDRWRISSARPRYFANKLSEAQIVSFLVFIVLFVFISINVK